MESELKNIEEQLHDKVSDMRAAAAAATVPAPVATRRTRVLQLYFGISLFVFTLITIVVRLDSDQYFDLDIAITKAIQSVTLPGFNTLMRIVSMPGNSTGIAALCVSAVFLILFMLRYRLEAYALLLSAAGGQLLNVTLKWLIGRPRPTSQLVNIFTEAGFYSFPSGHVTHYVAFYGLLGIFAYTLLRNSPVRIAVVSLCGLLVLLVGLSRIYLGAHWASDVTAAYIGASVWMLFVLGRYRHWVERSKR